MILAVCGAFYNPRKATCGEYWVECYGYNDLEVFENPFSVAVGGTVPLHAQATYADGSVDDFTTSSTWSSNNNPVAQVGASTGLVSGEQAGSVDIGAEYPLLVVVTGVICSAGAPVPCPVSIMGAAAPGAAWQPTYAVLTETGSWSSTYCTGTGIYRQYTAYDNFYHAITTSDLQWTLHENVTSSSNCGVTTGGTETEQTFTDYIANCQAGCTFTSQQWLTIVYNGYTWPLQAQDCVDSSFKKCTLHTGWNVTATTTPPYVTVTDF
jgi:hypothetical protein